MAGGTFTARNKVRPGAYINFTSEARPLGTVGERGTALVPMLLPFGPVGEMIRVTSDTDTRLTFGLDSDADALLTLRECAKRASEVLVWRLGGGEKAAFSGDGLTITAKWPGSGGNDIAVAVSGDAAPYAVEVRLSGRTVESFTASDGSEISSRLVVIEGTLALSAGYVLAGGADAVASASDWDDFFAAAALADFNTMAVPFEDSAVIEKAVAFVKEMREEQGVRIQAVVPETGADYEGIISIKNGVVLSDGTVVDKAAATAYFAGMTAGAAVNESCTYDVYDGATDAYPRMKETGIIEALNAGHVVFTARGSKVVIEQDQNSLISFSPEKSRAFGKNRVLRVLDMLAEDVQRIFEDYYLGKASNSADGRRLYQAELLSYLRQLSEISAIEEPVSEDVTVSAGDEPDIVIVGMAVQPVDSMEKLYMTVTVR